MPIARTTGFSEEVFTKMLSAPKSDSMCKFAVWLRLR